MIYDQNVTAGVPTGAQSSGTVVFTPPEAISPGIKVENVPGGYPDTGAGATLTLDGCLMTSNPGATCTSPFQSGKRIKQKVTGTGSTDLVFDIDASDIDMAFYQVFSRLINDSDQALAGVTVELGFGVGDDFVAATGDQLTFSTEFTAQPNNSGLSSTSQYPFGLFGDADDSPNFLLDGFFASDRTGFDLDQTATTITTGAYYGEYATIFGDWRPLSDVEEGLFWDFDDDAETDNLLMAWQIGDDLCELRRTVGETCAASGSSDPFAAPNCTFGVTLDDYITGSFDEIVTFLTDAAGSDYFSIFGSGEIEDLANLNLNYAIALGDLTGHSSFTLRTTAMPAVNVVPLPAGAPLMLGGLAALAVLRRRKTKVS